METVIRPVPFIYIYNLLSLNYIYAVEVNLILTIY